MNKNVLNRKFIHHAWFVNDNITVRQAIEYFASNIGDFALKNGPLTEQSKRPTITVNSDYVLYGTEDGESWRMSKEETTFFLFRRKFYKEFYKTHDFWDRMMVSEFADYVKAVNS